MMDTDPHSRLLVLFLFLALVLLVVQPTAAEIPLSTSSVSDKMSIMYRGAGGYFIGDSIGFDGTNLFGNTTVLLISGPLLPAEGVPLMDLNGPAGSGTPVDVNPEGTWKYNWYTANTNGIEKLQTARYTITAMDLAHPQNPVATSIYFKKPEFYVTAQPDTIKPGEYVQFWGNAENGVNSVRIDVTDLSGKVLRNFESPVSSSGYFNSGFHADMPPGQYYIVIANPIIKKTYRTILTVSQPEAGQTASPAGQATVQPTVLVTVPVPPASPGSTTPATGTIAVTSAPSGAEVYLDGKMAGTTPATLTAVPPGAHQIDIKSPDYQTVTLSVNVNAGETATISPVLQKNGSVLPVIALAGIGVLLVICVVGIVLFLRKRPATDDEDVP